jgi:hypothetical protein
MDIEMLQRFFFWSLVVNTGIYAFTAIAVLLMRNFICSIHKRLFDFDNATTMRSVQKYLGNYKLFITVFNFTPWIAILIIK